jgi:hypothetical protein
VTEKSQSSIVAVEVGAVVDPQGEGAVLLQLPNGYVVMKPDDARSIARSLVEVADEVQSLDEVRHAFGDRRS